MAFSSHLENGVELCRDQILQHTLCILHIDEARLSTIKIETAS